MRRTRNPDLAKLFFAAKLPEAILKSFLSARDFWESAVAALATSVAFDGEANSTNSLFRFRSSLLRGAPLGWSAA